MRTTVRSALLVLAFLIAAPAAGAPSINDTARGQRLDQLFEFLQNAPTRSAAIAAEEEISAIWMDSGDPAIERQIGLATQAMNEGFFDSALKVLDTIVVNRPDYVEGWNKRATLYYLVGDFDASLDDIARTLELEPRHFGALAGRGMVLLKQHKDGEALAAFKAAIAVNPALTNLQAQVRWIEAQMAGKRS